MNTEPLISVSMIHSTQELRTWLQADADNYKVLRGMSCLITRDSNNQITDVKFEPTGVVIHT